ncbi:MAG: transcription-repair coupling factor [Candidatus Gracilibacteria bacterium]|nr:transcription-repair coupling factor [Candidatus Gracilibacteria bacterium]MDD5179063.1 transcription-repair coupling factor [Candidatus Gracilibacteria bacterium]
MILRPFSSAFGENLFQPLEELSEKNSLTFSGAGNLSAKSLLIDKLFGAKQQLIVWVVNDSGEANALSAHLREWQTRPVKLFAAQQSDEETRAHTLRLVEEALALQEEKSIVITTYRDAQVLLPDLDMMERSALVIEAQSKLNRTEFFNDLIGRGYENVESETELIPGTYRATGSVISIFPMGSSELVKLDLDGEKIEKIIRGKEEIAQVKLLPISSEYETIDLIATLPDKAIIIADEIIVEENGNAESLGLDGESLPEIAEWLGRNPAIQKVLFTSFPEEGSDFAHLRFLSVLKYVTPRDLLDDLRSKKERGWKVLILTKQGVELKNILNEHNFIFREGLEGKEGVTIVDLGEEEFSPQAFQNPELKIAVLTDREIFGFQRSGKSVSEQKVYLDFITSLRGGDYVVHLDHGIGIFRGIEQKTVDEITREYLRIDYAMGDKLFVPIDQADKVNRFIGTGDAPPRLTRLGSSEWVTVQKRVAAETEQIAKELLALYAARAAAVGVDFGEDGKRQQEFENKFPYEETPGQLRAIEDVKSDMENKRPMDRLVCGDVGFGKTEVALRAAFKAAMAGKQVAFISPITILTDQHYKSFKKRLEGFDVSCEMLSRFKTAAQQKKILESLADGSTQIVIGTHRLLQPDIKFKDLGLVIIDEEQRFGVKQKETLKELRSQVDILTMTATPIPRTLNMALNKLRDITTITTPPPGRLPIITEVRHFSWKLIRDAILEELKRKGQVYFLHNRVATIEGIAEKLRSLIPEARFVVTHGQLKSDDLENRIFDFKDGKYDVLVSSAIIENGIDLPNANTLIVNDAENFGLSQLYQLRGRVGRSRTQAYAFFLYNTNHLKTDAKKRLRAIVEASELGAGFEIAMKDLEIRGAGDILGASQSGAINVVGVSHFVRMLNQAVEDIKAGKKIDTGTKGKTGAKADVTLEIPISAFIPVNYISDTKEKIRAYQKLSSVEDEKALNEQKMEIIEEYGHPPIEVVNLLKVIKLKLACRRAGVTSVKVGKTGPRSREAILTLGEKVKPANIMSVLGVNPAWQISGDKLHIDIEKLGVDWIGSLQEGLEALEKEYRSDVVTPKK